MSPDFVIPVPSVEKTVNKEFIYPGEPFTVTINLTGAEEIQEERVPTAVVIALDESSSMAFEDRFNSSRAAAIALAEMLVPGEDKAALITFSTDANVVVSLTTETADVVQAIQDLPGPEGVTNMSAAFEMALGELADDDTPNKIIILFTDGFPEPFSVHHINYMVGPLLEEAKDLGVQIFPVTFEAEQAWLEDIAEETFGIYTDTDNMDELATIFESAFAAVNHVLTTRNLVITEEIAPEFQYIAGSLNYSFSGPGETEQFTAAVEEGEANFGATSSITFPPLAILPQDRIFTITFQVTSYDCLTPLSPELEILLDIDTIPPSAVQYTTGGDATHIVAIPQRQIICKRPGDLIIEKTFDEINLSVNLSLRNAYQDRSITNIEIFEAVTEHFEPLLLTAVPPLDGQAIITYSTPHLRYLYWHIEELEPLESREFSFKVRVLACSPEESPPLQVNHFIPIAVQHIPCKRGSQIKYYVPLDLEEPFQIEEKYITFVEEPRLIVLTSGVFELPPCPTRPGSLSDTIGTGRPSGCPEDFLDASSIICLVCEMIHSNLFGVDMGDRLFPELAHAFEINSDQLEYTIELRRGVKFHDGTPLSSQVVLYNFQNTVELFPGIIRPPLTTIGVIDSLKAIDDLTLHFRLPGADPAFLRKLTGIPGIIASPNTQSNNPIGAGPFRLTQFDPQKHALLKSFSEYWGSSPQIRRLIYLSIAHEAERLKALLAGEIDIMVGQDSLSYDQIKQSTGFTLHGTPDNFRAASEQVQDFECLPNLKMQLHKVRSIHPLRVGLPRSWYVCTDQA